MLYHCPASIYPTGILKGSRLVTTESAHARVAAPTAVVPLSPLGRETSHYEPALSAALQRVVRSGYYVGGPEVAAFTDAFSAYCGAQHCVGVGNGTDALEAALRAVGVSAGDEVITVANAGGYSTTAILAIGAVPVYADIDPETMLLNVGSAASAVSVLTRAVVVTHLYGAAVDVVSVRAALSEATDGEVDTAAIAVIEDCAQAHGATVRGQRVGSLGDAAAFSFYPTKNLGALGDAGAVVTSDAGVAERAAAIAQYGWADRRYHATVGGGRNSRLDPVQAAVLAVKLDQLDVMNARRREIAAQYADALTEVAGVRLVHAGSVAGLGAGPDAELASVFHLAVLDCDDRVAVAGALETAGVQTAVHYPNPDHDQPAYDGRFTVRGSLDETERAAERVLTIPCHPLLTEAEVERVCAALRTLPAVLA